MLLLQSENPTANHAMRAFPVSRQRVAKHATVQRKPSSTDSPTTQIETKQLSSLLLCLAGVGSSFRSTRRASCLLGVVAMIVSCRQLQHSWTEKGSGGDQVGQLCTKGSSKKTQPCCPATYSGRYAGGFHIFTGHGPLDQIGCRATTQDVSRKMALVCPKSWRRGPCSTPVRKAQPDAAAVDGAVLTQVRTSSALKIITSGRCQLVVVAIDRR